jgi:hypothetical protein
MDRPLLCLDEEYIAQRRKARVVYFTFPSNPSLHFSLIQFLLFPEELLHAPPLNPPPTPYFGPTFKIECIYPEIVELLPNNKREESQK